ncbi:MAG: XRE family transcriptional regulator [Hyphomicrobium sp.]
MSPAARTRTNEITRRLLAEMPLQELRQARALSQEQLAEILQIEQASVSKMERRTDMYISTLRKFIEAMGGELDITARYPEGSVRLNQFKDLDQDEEARATS